MVVGAAAGSAPQQDVLDVPFQGVVDGGLQIGHVLLHRQNLTGQAGGKSA